MKLKKVIGVIIALGLLTVGYLSNKEAQTAELYFYSHDNPVHQEIIEKFEAENPNINIVKVDIPKHENRLEFIEKAIEDPTKQVDLIDSDIVWTYTLAKNNHVLALDEYFTNNELNNFFSSALHGNIIDDKLYGIPYRTDTGILYYRKDLLNKYNQKIPKTYTELIQVYETISKDEDIYGLGGSWYPYEGLTCNAMELLWTYGGQLNTDPGHNTNIIDTDENRYAFKKMKKLVDDGITHPDIFEFKSSNLREAFINGNLLFMRDWPTGWHKIEESEKLSIEDQVGITYLPLGEPNGDNSGALGGWQLMVSKTSEHREKSVQFIKFFTNYENNKGLILGMSYLPVRNDLYNDSDIISEIPFVKRNVKLFSNARHRPFHEDYVNFSQIYIDNISKYLKGEVTLDEFLKTTETKMQNIIN
ncbi:MAG TPA: extracellular solute-binding protein [Clostridia bacterium]|nr:extracellular solute-binding protein [Clostridia bacterium]